jgi:hypothetical protein
MTSSVFVGGGLAVKVPLVQMVPLSVPTLPVFELAPKMKLSQWERNRQEQSVLKQDLEAATTARS